MANPFPTTANFTLKPQYVGDNPNSIGYEATSSNFPYVQWNPDGTVSAYYIDSGSASGGGQGREVRYKQGAGGQWELVPGSETAAQWAYDDPKKALLKGALTIAALYTAGTGLNSLLGTGGSGLMGGAGAMAPSDALLMAGGEPIAGSGFSMASSGAPSFGTAFTPAATLSAAGEAGGSLVGLPNMVGVPGAVSGGMASVGTTAAEMAGVPVPGVTTPAAPVTMPVTQPTPGTPPAPPAPPNPGSETDLLKNVPSWLKDNASWLIPLLGAGAGFLDAKNQQGKTTGDPWSTDFLRKHSGEPNPGLLNTKPTFSTGLMGPWGKY